MEWCVGEGYLLDKQGDALKDFNDIRNDFAHILGHQLTFDRVFTLAEKFGDAGFDFSDETIYSDRQLSEEWYGIDGAMIDIISAIFFELAWLLAENGGKDYTGG